MGSSSLGESDDEDHTVFYFSKPAVVLKALNKLAQSAKNPEHVHNIVASLGVVEDPTILNTLKSRKRSSNEVEEIEENSDTENDNTPPKRSRLLKRKDGKDFECDECELTFFTKASLENHINAHASLSNAPNESKHKEYQCVLCYKKRADIQRHYTVKHHVNCPQQIMSYKGSFLIEGYYSNVDTKQGKAPWFKKERERAIERLTNVNCRLCEGEPLLLNTIILSDHYKLVHMVEPAMLTNIECLFRPEKRPDLDLTNSETPKKRKKQSYSTSVQNTADEKKKNRNNEWSCRECGRTYVNKGNLVRHIKKAHGRSEECHQVYPSEALLNKHKIETHSQSPENKRWKCALCEKLYTSTSISEHCKNIHDIEYPEQLMFMGGRGLVSDIDTQDGKASWFLKERRKVTRYTDKTCRLCDTEYDSPAMLAQHYDVDHKVISKALTCLPHLFRAQLADLPTSVKKRDQKNSKVDSSNVDPAIKNQTVRETENSSETADIMYQCKKCNVATTTYDASVEHAQLHFVDGYKPIPVKCGLCNLAFEAVCFANHGPRHNNKYKYRILKYDPSNLLNDKWFDMFQALPESHASRIKSSSKYQHTRRVKMNSDASTGTALYQCAMCRMYIEPEDVENHCKTKNCKGNMSQNHHCHLCNINFNTAIATSKHFQQHRQGSGTGSFRKVTFKDTPDNTVNVALQKSRNDSRPIEESKETTESNVVKVFCEICKTFINDADYEAHAATHINSYQHAVVNEEENPTTESDASQEPPVRTQHGNEFTKEDSEADNEDVHCEDKDESEFFIKGKKSINFADVDAHADSHKDSNQRVVVNENDNPTAESDNLIEPIIRTQQENEQITENPENDDEDPYCEICDTYIKLTDFDAHADSHKDSNQRVAANKNDKPTVESDTFMEPIIRTQQENEQITENPENDDEDPYCEICDTYIKLTDFDAHADLHKDSNQRFAVKENENPTVESDTLIEPIIRTQQENEQITENPEDDEEEPYCEICDTYIKLTDFDAHADSHKDSNERVKVNENDNPTVESDTFIEPIIRTQQENEQITENPENDDEDPYCEICDTYIKLTDFDAHADLHKDSNQRVAVKENDNPTVEKDTLIEPIIRTQPENEQITEKSHRKCCVNKQSENIRQNELAEVTDTLQSSDSENDSCYSLRISTMTVKAQVHSANDNSHCQSESTTGINDADTITDDTTDYEDTEDVLKTIDSIDFSPELGNDLKRDFLRLFQLVCNKTSVQNTQKFEGESSESIISKTSYQHSREDSGTQMNKNMVVDKACDNVEDKSKKHNNVTKNQVEEKNYPKEKVKERNAANCSVAVSPDIFISDVPDFQNDISKDMVQGPQTQKMKSGSGASTNTKKNESTSGIHDFIDLTDADEEDTEGEQRPSESILANTQKITQKKMR